MINYCCSQKYHYAFSRITIGDVVFTLSAFMWLFSNFIVLISNFNNSPIITTSSLFSYTYWVIHNFSWHGQCFRGLYLCITFLDRNFTKNQAIIYRRHPDNTVRWLHNVYLWVYRNLNISFNYVQFSRII